MFFYIHWFNLVVGDTLQTWYNVRCMQLTVSDDMLYCASKLAKSCLTPDLDNMLTGLLLLRLKSPLLMAGAKVVQR